MAEVRWTDEAARWLGEIHDFIAADNPDAAERTVRGIYDLAQTLSSFPERGYRFQGSPGRSVRIVLYGHFRIAYLVQPNGDVEILGVFHGALDIQRFLG